ncbi:hypothetical protein ACIQNQ_33590 [Streptomyces werraensis]|uniref:hypothetical protein n=1 Tax=Streptomyces werraensis TaxID=68284 RepID=UPI0037FF7267
MRAKKGGQLAARASRLTRKQLPGALKRAGRQRGIEAEAERLRDVFRADWAHQPIIELHYKVFCV